MHLDRREEFSRQRDREGRVRLRSQRVRFPLVSALIRMDPLLVLVQMQQDPRTLHRATNANFRLRTKSRPSNANDLESHDKMNAELRVELAATRLLWQRSHHSFPLCKRQILQK